MISLVRWCAKGNMLITRVFQRSKYKFGTDHGKYISAIHKYERAKSPIRQDIIFCYALKYMRLRGCHVPVPQYLIYVFAFSFYRLLQTSWIPNTLVITEFTISAVSTSDLINTKFCNILFDVCLPLYGRRSV